MKKFICSSVLAAALFTANTPKAQAAEVVLITTGGIVATVAIGAIGYAGYGTTILTLGLSGKQLNLKAEQYEKALDVVASGDTSLVDEDLQKLLSSVREADKRLEAASDLQILTALVDAANGK